MATQPNDDLFNFQRKAEHYRNMLANTQRYRDAWRDSLKAELIATLREAIEAGRLDATVEERQDIVNLGAVVLSLGLAHSGLGENVGENIRRELVKTNGALVYQQLFNGKILVLINFPHIEKYGQPQPPRQIAIYRPEELKRPYLIRHLEEFITEMANWEDFDDERPESQQRIGFKLNFEQEQAKK